MYTLELGIGSFDDGLFGGAAYFDGITVSSVPDAGCTLALLLVSAMGVQSLTTRLRKSR
jgi:hypothetical protein